MTQNQLMTAGAVAFAAFAAWYVLRKPAQAGDIARNSHVQALMDAFDRQTSGISFGASTSEYNAQLSRLGISF